MVKLRMNSSVKDYLKAAIFSLKANNCVSHLDDVAMKRILAPPLLERWLGRMDSESRSLMFIFPLLARDYPLFSATKSSVYFVKKSIYSWSFGFLFLLTSRSTSSSSPEHKSS